MNIFWRYYLQTIAIGLGLLTLSIISWALGLLLGVAPAHDRPAMTLLLCLLCGLLIWLLAILFFRFYYIKIGRKNPSIDEILASCKKIDPPKDT
jgi:hypothetical protein